MSKSAFALLVSIARHLPNVLHMRLAECTEFVSAAVVLSPRDLISESYGGNSPEVTTSAIFIYNEFQHPACSHS